MLVDIKKITKALWDAFQACIVDGHTSFLGYVRIKWGGDTSAFWVIIGYTWHCVALLS